MKRILLLVLSITVLNTYSQDFRKYFDSYGVKGSFMMYDMNNDKYVYYDSARCFERFTPASTFKIPNSIIGLETGVITDENFVIPWDSVKRREACDKDMNLEEAIKYSCIAYYQELAKRVGEVKMKEMLTAFNYGNLDISDGIDRFWLKGSLKISQAEQIIFLKKLFEYKLPVSKRSIEILKKIIILADTSGYIMRGKTGWGFQDNKDIGWLIGWVEKDGNVYFYATNIESDAETESFAPSRRSITESILRDLEVIK